MSYLNFLLLFIVLPIMLLGMALYQRRDKIPFSFKRVACSILAICSIAFLYTVPWDNYLVANNIWWYPEERVVGRIGYVPIEEYCFFVLQPILESLLILLLLTFKQKTHSGSSKAKSWKLPFLLMLSLFLLLLFGIFAYIQGKEFTYLALILVWACPVLLALMIWKPRVISRNAGTLYPSLLIGTLYLCVVDLYAINEGIWAITTDTSLPIFLFGLPIEEAIFYFLSSFLSCFGFLLFLNIWNLYERQS